MYLLKYSWSSITRNAWRNRQELISAGLTSRRDLMKLGLLTSTGYLLAKHGLSSRVANAKEMVLKRYAAKLQCLVGRTHSLQRTV